ncbi:MAG: hypothetical protein IPL35_16465 [Sphingobacteriales bacterium]|nr:hypothetical protein [Sphingobacteriales bacterium]
MSLPGIPSCANGIMRPWGLGFDKGVGYLGMVCDASISRVSTDLIGYVFSFDPANPQAGLTLELTINLGTYHSYKPWSYLWSQVHKDDFSPQPVVSDIAITEEGDMIINIMDRWGHQMGLGQPKALSGDNSTITATALGDMLYACYDGSSWALEGTVPSCPQLNTDTGTNTSYGLTTMEYFEDLSGDGSAEANQGASLLLLGTQDLISIVMDPIAPGEPTGTNYWSTGGYYWYDHTTGDKFQWTRVYPREWQGSFGKANGLGDIDFVNMGPQPLEIGNRVWIDTDEDGVQDPEELPIPDVSIELLDNLGNVVGTTITDANGTWYFNTSNVTGGILPYSTYTVRIASSDWSSGSGTGTLQGYLLTTADTDITIDGDFRDSDATLVSNIPTISVTTDDYGQNNHTLDMGFREAVTCVPIPDIVLACDSIGAPSSYDLPDATDGSMWSLLYTPSGTSASIDPTTGLITNLSTAGDYVAILGGGACIDTVHVVQPVCNLPCLCYQATQEGYADFSALGTTIISGAATGSFVAPIPGHGSMTVDYSITSGGRVRQEPTTFTSLDALAYTSLYTSDVPWPVQPIYLETSAGNTQTINFTFDTPIADFDFIVYDVDQNDQVVITATDADGNVITDLSNWIVMGTGDATTAVASGQTTGTVGATPTYDAATGTISSPENINHNRPFIAIRPDELIKSISISFTSSTTGNHVYFDIYGTLSSASAPCCPVCTLTVDSAVPTACSNNLYDVDVTVSYINPAVGDIIINVGGTDYTFTPDGNSPDTLTVTGITADAAQDVDVSATFVNDTVCTDTLVAAYDAPCACNVDCDDGNCMNGLETYDAASCACVPGTPVTPLTCDDGNCMNGVETWSDATCACIPGTPVTPLTCDDGNCMNGVETWSDATCACVPGTPVTPLTCDDGNCMNGVETWSDATCACIPGTPVTPLTCDDGNCMNGVETWSDASCACVPAHQLHRLPVMMVTV